MMRVVLDTNILVSSFLVAVGAPARILAAWRAGTFELLLSPALLAEFERVMTYPRLVRRHGLTPTQVTAEAANLTEFAILVIPTSVPAVIAEDPDDDQVLACAVAGAAQYIVSGDPDLLTVRAYQGIRILTPAVFLTLLDETSR